MTHALEIQWGQTKVFLCVRRHHGNVYAANAPCCTHTAYAAGLLITDADIKELRTLHTHIHVASPEMQKRAACLLANLVSLPHLMSSLSLTLSPLSISLAPNPQQSLTDLCLCWTLHVTRLKTVRSHTLALSSSASSSPHYPKHHPHSQPYLTPNT